MRLFTQRVKQLFIIIALLIIGVSVNAQKKLTIANKSQIIETAIEELNKAFTPPEGKLFLSISPFPKSGKDYIFDLTIGNKDCILTVFCVNNGEGDVKLQNHLEALLRSYKFLFRIPKNQRHKFQYQINY